MLYGGFASDLNEQGHSAIADNSSFQKLVRQKYQFPPEQIRQEFHEELQKPLTITVDEIRKDLNKFVQGFPTDRIPHTTDDEMYQRQQQKSTLESNIKEARKNQNEHEKLGALSSTTGGIKFG